MSEKEYNVYVLCINYSLEDILSQLAKKQASPDLCSAESDAIYSATVEELSLAIECYHLEKYAKIRDDLKRTKQRLHPNLHSAHHFA